MGLDDQMLSWQHDYALAQAPNSTGFSQKLFLCKVFLISRLHKFLQGCLSLAQQITEPSD